MARMQAVAGGHYTVFLSRKPPHKHRGVVGQHGDLLAIAAASSSPLSLIGSIFVGRRRLLYWPYLLWQRMKVQLPAATMAATDWLYKLVDSHLRKVSGHTGKRPFTI